MFTGFLDGLLWSILGTVVAVLAVYQVVAKPGERVAALEERVAAYRALDFDLVALTREIRDTAAFGSDARAKFDQIMERKQDLVLSYVDAESRPKLKERCENEVITELPSDSFYVPG